MGDEPTEFSTNKKLNKDNDYSLISYKEDILAWLDKCRKEVAVYPLIRETITQYINLINSSFAGKI
jgi:hypothetical protein